MTKPTNNVGLWVNMTQTPAGDGTFTARTRAGEQVYAEFHDGKWDGNTKAHQWFCTPADVVGGPRMPTLTHADDNRDFLERVSDAELHSMTSRSPSATDQQFAATATLARYELQIAQDALRSMKNAAVNIEVFRVYRPKTTANGTPVDGVVLGKWLSVSEHFAAQSAGDGAIVIHDRSHLTHADQSGKMSPGDLVTVAYENGAGVVYPGEMQAFALRVSGKGLTHGELEYIREQAEGMLSDRGKWVDFDQNLLNDVAIGVCKQAKEHFGWDRTPSTLVVEKYDVLAEKLKSSMDEADKRSALWKSVTGFTAAPPGEAPSVQRPRG